MYWKHSCEDYELGNSLEPFKKLRRKTIKQGIKTPSLEIASLSISRMLQWKFLLKTHSPYIPQMGESRWVVGSG